MTPREQAKERNREKIKEAAERIIREEGIEKLTMRHLAQQTEVSLRTPYNLFGSKTELLIALLDGAFEQISGLVAASGQNTPLIRVFKVVDGGRAFFARDEAYYREIYWAIMTSDQPDARMVAYNQLIGLTRILVLQAVEAEELDPPTDPEALGEHLAILLMSVVGMWAGGMFDVDACHDHIQRAWRVQIETVATDQGRRALTAFFAGEAVE